MRQVLGVLLGMMATIYRDLLHLHSGSGAAISNVQAKADLTKMASRVNLEDARRAIRSLCKAEYQLNLNANRKLCLENLAIELARLGES